MRCGGMSRTNRRFQGCAYTSHTGYLSRPLFSNSCGYSIGTRPSITAFLERISTLFNTVRIKIQVPRRWNIRAGQYINMRLSGVGCRELLESHLFMIVSWAMDASLTSKLTTVHLLVEPRDRFANRLLRYAKRSSEGTRYLVLYSGPHGIPTLMKEYKTVLMIATGFGIAAVLLHLQELLDGDERCEVVTRRVHIVWQLKGEVMRPYLVKDER